MAVIFNMIFNAPIHNYYVITCNNKDYVITDIMLHGTTVANNMIISTSWHIFIFHIGLRCIWIDQNRIDFESIIQRIRDNFLQRWSTYVNAWQN